MGVGWDMWLTMDITNRFVYIDFDEDKGPQGTTSVYATPLVSIVRGGYFDMERRLLKFAKNGERFGQNSCANIQYGG